MGINMRFNIEQIPPTKSQLALEESKLKSREEILVFFKKASLVLLIPVVGCFVYLNTILLNLGSDLDPMLLTLAVILTVLIIFGVFLIWTTLEKKEMQAKRDINMVTLVHENALNETTVHNIIFSSNSQISKYVDAVSRQGRTICLGEFQALRECYWSNSAGSG